MHYRISYIKGFVRWAAPLSWRSRHLRRLFTVRNQEGWVEIDLANLDVTRQSAATPLSRGDFLDIKAVLIGRGRTEARSGKQLETCHMQASSLNREWVMQCPSTILAGRLQVDFSARQRWRSVADLSCRSMVTRGDLAVPSRQALTNTAWNSV